MYDQGSAFVISKRRVATAIAILFGVLLLSFGIYWFTHYTRVSIKNEGSIPFTLTIDGSKKNIKGNTSLWVKNGSYLYQGVAKPNKTEISIVNTLDTDTTTELVFNYTIYTNAAIRDALCNPTNQQPCDIRADQLTVTFVEDYSWAVVKQSAPNTNDRWAVLQLQNGKWEVRFAPEPNTGNLGLLGVFPSSVGEVIREN